MIWRSEKKNLFLTKKERDSELIKFQEGPVGVLEKAAMFKFSNGIW